MINIIIADDHPIFRQGLVSILEKCHDINLMAQAEDGKEALKLIKTLKPDVAILDIDMPFYTGLDVVRQLNKIGFKCNFVILTMLKELDLLNEVKGLKIKGYLLKDSASDDLINCIKTVFKGDVCIDNSVLDQLKSTTSKNEYLDNLSKTEKNVLKLIARDFTTKEIAEMLFVSPKTIENHRSNICKKLNISGSNAIQFFLKDHQINHF